MRDVLRRGGSNLDFTLLSTIYAEDATTSSIAQASAATSQNRDALARMLLPKLLDIDAGRIAVQRNIAITGGHRADPGMTPNSRRSRQTRVGLRPSPSGDRGRQWLVR